MKILVCDTDEATRKAFEASLSAHELHFTESPLSPDSIALCPDAEALSVFIHSKVDATRIAQLPQLTCIAARSTGIDNIDLVAATARGIVVSNVPKYGAHTVAEFVFALLLSLSRRICEAWHRVHEEASFSSKALEGFELFGKTIGVVGTGAIGRNVAKIAVGFGMQVLMFDKFPDVSLQNEHATYVSFDELLTRSDIISLHVPFVPENKHIINADAFAKMKKGTILINTARGELVDTQALLESLKSATLAGVGLDVLEGERALQDELELLKGDASTEELKAVIGNHALVGHASVIITPHIAFFTTEAYGEILSISAANLLAFAAGTPQNAAHV